MRDGVMLGRALKRAAKGLVGLQDALPSYESAMLSYGFDVGAKLLQPDSSAWLKMLYLFKPNAIALDGTHVESYSG